MVNHELSIAPMHRICKKAGAARVSESAAKELAKELEEIGIKIAKEANRLALHTGRKTVQGKDIKEATRIVMEK